MDKAAGIGAIEFFAEESDVDVDDVAFDGGVEVVDVLPDFGAGDGAIDIEGEVFEECIFAGAQFDFAAGAADLAEGGVDFEIADADGGGMGIVLAADECADAGKELGEFEGFDEVVVGTEIEAPDAVLGGVASGEDEDVAGGVRGAQGFEDGEAVDLGEHEVEDDDIVLSGAGEAESVFAVAGGIDSVTGFLEALDHGFAERCEIFDDENAHGGARGKRTRKTEVEHNAVR